MDSNGITNRNGRLAGELEESGGSDQSDDDAGIDAELEEEIENADMAFWGFWCILKRVDSMKGALMT